MVLEVAILKVKEGLSLSFEEDFGIAECLIKSISGYIRHELKKCVEDDHKYILMVEWVKLEDHTIGFRKSEVYMEWKALLHHYYDPFPTVEHYI